MSVIINKTDRIITATVEKKYGKDGKSLEFDVDAVNKKIGVKKEGEQNFTYTPALDFKFSDLTSAEKDELKLTFDQLTQAEKDSLVLKFEDLTQAQKEELKAPITAEVEEIRQITEAISAGEGGKAYDSLSEAQSLDPKPADGTVFTVLSSDAENAGYHKFDSAEAGGTMPIRDFPLLKEDIYAVGKNIYNGVSVKSAPWVGYVSCWHSDYIPVEESSNYVISGLDYTTLQYYQVAYYDENKVKISNSNPSVNPINANDRDASTPVNCRFIIVIYHKSDGTPGDTSSMQIEKGNKSTYYVPHLIIPNYVRIEETDKYITNFTDLPEVKESSKNLYNPYTRVYIKTNTDGTKVYTSDYIPVVENLDYYYSRPHTANSYYYNVYDSNKNLLRQILTPNLKTISGDSYVKLLQVNGTTDTTDVNEIYEDINVPIQFENSKFPTAYEPKFQFNNYLIRSKLPYKFQKELFTNKICYVIGDSITHAGYWTTELNNQLDFGKMNVLGSSGCTWVDQGNTNNIKERVDAIENSVITNGVPDIIIIALGTNDWGNSLQIGDYATTMAKTFTDVQGRTSVYDAVKYGITRIKKLYPDAAIVLTTPVQRVGKYDTDYIDAVVRSGKMMSVPVIDVYSNSGLIPYDDWLNLYYQDGLHETELGGQVHGAYVANELINIYY